MLGCSRLPAISIYFDLAQEALGPHDLGDLRPHDLDGHLAVVLEVLRQVNRRHAAAAEFTFDLVAVGEG